MKCPCGGDFRVIDTASSQKKYEEGLRRISQGVRDAVPVKRFWWRKRKCRRCGKVYQTVELFLEDVHKIHEGVSAFEMTRYLELPEEDPCGPPSST